MTSPAHPPAPPPHLFLLFCRRRPSAPTRARGRSSTLHELERSSSTSDSSSGPARSSSGYASASCSGRRGRPQSARKRRVARAVRSHTAYLIACLRLSYRNVYLYYDTPYNMRSYLNEDNRIIDLLRNSSVSNQLTLSVPVLPIGNMLFE